MSEERIADCIIILNNAPGNGKRKRIELYKAKQWKWRWKYKQLTKIKPNTNYHLTEFRFFDKDEEEIKL